MTSARVRTVELFNAFHQWGFDDRGWTVKTRQGYFYRCQQAEGWLRANAGRGLAGASTKHLKAFLATLPKNPRTRNSLRCALVAFYDFLVDQGIRDDNPARAIRHLKEPKCLPRPFDQALAHRLYVASRIDERTHALVCLYLFVGLRRDEARSLEWVDVDERSGWVHVVQGKGRKDRTVPLHEAAAQAMLRWRMKSAGVGYVFPSPRRPNAPISRQTLYRIIGAAGDAAGVHVVPHGLRHTFATHALRGSKNMRGVQKLLGHESLASTEIYTDVWPDELLDTVATLPFAKAAEDELGRARDRRLRV